MAMAPQPAQKSYFFGKGYTDLLNTIKGAWERNFATIAKYKTNIAESRANDENRALRIFKFIVNVVAMIAVMVFGSFVTAAVSLINIIVLLVFMLFVYIGFTAIWFADRVYLERNKIFTACNECKKSYLIPTYVCPKCGAEHTQLYPSVYGILKRTCIGNDPAHPCGEILPTTFFNGRRELKAICANPECRVVLSDRESRPLCIPIVGGRSVGKTAFITAFSKDFIDQVAPAHSWDIEFYNDKKKAIYDEIETDYLKGSTRMTDRPQDITKPSSVSFSFFVKGQEFKPERLVHVYDIAGEVFTDNAENEVQQQYEYCQGMVMIVDPFSIPSVRHRLEDKLTPEDVAGIGMADINGIVDGIKGCINKVADAVKGVADKIKSFLHFSVPDEGPLADFESWMPDFMQGLAGWYQRKCKCCRRCCQRLCRQSCGNDQHCYQKCSVQCCYSGAGLHGTGF